MKVKVDQNKCIGCGVCVDLAEKVFEMKNGLSSPIESADMDLAENQEAAKMSVDVCPVQAISVEME